jgi:hypothetical protein
MSTYYHEDTDIETFTGYQVFGDFNGETPGTNWDCLP